MMSKKSLYRIKNWSQYNQSLVQRGSVTLWFSEDVQESWLFQGPNHQGRNYIYSDTAIECALTIRAVFHLPFRQTEGFLLSMFDLARIDLPIPNYTTLEKRQKDLCLDLAVSPHREPIHIAIDSSGLKVYGEGEWKVRMHGKSKRRAWRKIHLGINTKTQEIEAECITKAFGNDGNSIPNLLDQILDDIEVAYMDGGYDTHTVHEHFQDRETTAVIPPQHNAKIRCHGNSNRSPLPRDEILRTIRKQGRKNWKKQSNYHQRSLAEVAMFRQKCIFGSQLRSRVFVSQKQEFTIRCKALNKITQLGMPEGEWVEE